MRVVGLLALWLVACSSEGGGLPDHGGEEAEEKVEPATVVEVAEVTTGDVSDLLITSAVVESEAAADLYPAASGLVLSVHKEEGDAVRKGELLAVLDNATLDASAERTRAEVSRLQEQVDEARRLRAEGAISDRELVDLEHQLTSARTSAREASRTQAETRITAPFDGVVGAREIRVGELASSGKRAFAIVDLDRLRVVASLPERDVSRVKVGQLARLVSAYDDDAEAHGHVARIAPIIDATSGTFRVTIELDPGEDVLRPGQFVSVELEVERHEGVVVVPRPAIRYEDGAPVVYRMVPEPEETEEEAPAEGGEEVAEEGGSWWPFGGADEAEADDETEDEAEEPREPGFVADRVLVTLGLSDLDSAEVVEGVAVGDQVVVVGHTNLADGARIRLPSEEPAEADAPEVEEAE